MFLCLAKYTRDQRMDEVKRRMPVCSRMGSSVVACESSQIVEGRLLRISILLFLAKSNPFACEST
jgi:hypothetical protein